MLTMVEWDRSSLPTSQRSHHSHQQTGPQPRRNYLQVHFCGKWVQVELRIVRDIRLTQRSRRKNKPWRNLQNPSLAQSWHASVSESWVCERTHLSRQTQLRKQVEKQMDDPSMKEDGNDEPLHVLSKVVSLGCSRRAYLNHWFGSWPCGIPAEPEFTSCRQSRGGEERHTAKRAEISDSAYTWYRVISVVHAYARFVSIAKPNCRAVSAQAMGSVSGTSCTVFMHGGNRAPRKMRALPEGPSIGLNTGWVHCQPHN
jgi:hypothetical protein